MSLHKITAGAGYDYLTRQVAAMDSSEKGHTGLASYYEQKGESPGVWVGSGLVGLDGLSAGDPVTAEQMRLLFGSGMHPLADQRLAELPADASDADRRAASRLGNPFLVIEHDVPEFQIAVAKAYAAYNEAKGVPGDWPVPKEVRWQIRTDLATASFTELHGRPPADSRELHGHLATLSRPQTTAVAGFDLTFSPVKSVSALWALADPATAAVIERAHNAAIAEALRFIERRALFTRTGAQGVRQVDVTGLVGTAFTHRDSRAGDPDLHTHVAVANKVQTVTDGCWLAIDGRLLFKAKVTASEVYNTALERHLAASLGVRFAERPQPDARKRAVRELVGIDPALNARWSARRAAIEDRQGELAARFQEAQERPPTVIEARTLAQQATLETRPAKHSPRSLAEQRQAWRSEADAVLGAGGVERMIAATLHPGCRRNVRTNGRWVRREAARIVATVEASRSTWQDWHVRAEAFRVVRAAEVPADRVDEVVGRLVHAALTRHSIRLAPPPDDIVEPAQLRRLDGQSVYSVAGDTWHTSARILAAEQRLVDAAGRVGGHLISDAVIDVALLEAEANRTPLNAGQAALVQAMSTSGRLVQLAIAPAGAGKTTAMRTLAQAWQSGGGTVIGLAPSASAAAQLGEQIGHQADTLALLTHALATGRPLPDWAQSIDPQSLVIIDEAGMADTLTLDRVVEFVLDRAGSVRLIGDTQQLAAIGAGGVLRDIEVTQGALRLNELVRFADPAEAAASLALRDGDPSALGFYLDQRRVHVGDQTACVENLFQAWATDRAAGLDALMLAPTRDLVAALNQRAQAHLHGHRPGPTVLLADGNTAGIGDVIITRTNNRRLATTASDWVKNGDRWHITTLNTNGSMTVVHQHTSARVVLPAAYVAASVDLGYACTIHAAQGVTADTMHGLLTADETRQQLYTMLTRGRLANHAYLQVIGSGDPHSLIRPEAILPPTATDLLEAILGRDEQPLSASSTARQLADPAGRLAGAAHRYADAIGFAAEATTPPATLAALDGTAEQLVPGLTDSPAWPTLRSHLILDAASGIDPVRALTDAVGKGPLADAADPAAVLDWRLQPLGRLDSLPGPLPWLPGIPDGLAGHADWGDYLRRRHELVMELAQQVRADAVAAEGRPGWLPSSITSPDPATIGDVAVWRAAHGIPDQDTRPTGERQHAPLERRHQRQLDQRVVDHLAPAAAEWTPTITTLAPATASDAFVPVLAYRLAQVASARLDAAGLLRAAITEGPLPDDHSAAALSWRISRYINPAVATQLHSDYAELLTHWLPEMERLVGPERSRSLQDSAWWPPLVASVENALHRGWHLDQLINANPPEDGIDEAQALVWRTNLLLAPIPDDVPEPEPRWESIDLPDSAPIHLGGPDPGLGTQERPSWESVRPSLDHLQCRTPSCAPPSGRPSEGPPRV